MATTVTPTEYSALLGEIRDVKSQIADINTKMTALPDKSAIYTASLAIHAMIWATILGTIIAMNVLEII